MSFGRYALGVGALLCVLGSFGAAAFALRASLLPAWRGAPARLAEVVLGLGMLVVTLQALGTIGLFRLVPVVVASLALGGTIWFKFRPRAAGQADRQPWQWNWPYTLAVGLSLIVAGVVLAEWAGPTLQSWGRGILGADSVAYHMPWAASFAQTGQITSIRYTDIEWLTGFYPATSELLHGLGIVLMGNDVASPGLNFVWLSLVLLAAWCVGQPRGLGPVTLLAGAVAMATPMMFFSTAGSADNDIVGVFFLLAAVALWINAGSIGAVDREPGFDLTGLLPAAVAAGLAISVKLNLVAPIAALTVAVILWAPTGLRARVAKLWLAAGGVAGGFWYLRNLFAVGNPLPYFSFGVLPTPTPPPTQQHNNSTIVDYLSYPRILKTFFHGALANGLGPWWYVIVILAFAGPILCIAFGPTRLVRLLGGVALFAIVAYVFTPGSASGPWGHPKGFNDNLRYVAPPLTVALTLIPLAAPLLGKRVRWFVFAGFGAIFLATVAQQRLWGPGYSRIGEVIAAIIVLVLGAAAVRWPWPSLHAPVATVRRLALATALLTLGLAGVAGGFSGQKHYLRGRYVKQPGLNQITVLWRWARTVHHQHIALSGTLGWYFGYPLYGMDNSNNVAYLGKRGANGSFRQIATCQQWRSALNAGHYHYVVTAASRTMWTGRIRSSPEGGWTQSDPHAKLLFPLGPRPWFQVYQLSGQLNPSGCP